MFRLRTNRTDSLRQAVMLTHLILLVVACAAGPSLAIKPDHISEQNSKSSESSDKLDEISGEHQQQSKTNTAANGSNILYNVTNIGFSHPMQNLSNDANLLESLKSKKLANKKKNMYPGIILHNSPQSPLSDEISGELNKFEAYSKLLSQLMHRIVNKDLGLTSMQQKIDSMSVDSNRNQFDSIIDTITDKIQNKINDINSVIEITGERIQEIFKQQLNSNSTTNQLSCCDFYNSELTKPLTSEHDLKSKEQELLNQNSHFQFDGHFNTWVNKQFSCDIGDLLGRPHFFNPSGSNLTKQFDDNLALYPNIKWQYFMSFLGVHTEYPSYLPPSSFCFLHTFNNEHLNVRTSVESSTNDRAGFTKLPRYKVKNKKHDALFHHRKAYNELNQLFVQRHRENLLATALPQNKLVVIVIDRGSALTDHQLNIAKSVAKYILNSLSHRDKVAIVDLTSVTHHPSVELCSSRVELAYANYETKLSYGRYIDDMQRSHNSTNHHLGFQRAFEIIASNYQAYKADVNSEPEIFIPYISRGLLSSLADAKPVMELISSELKNCSYNFVINCYALIDESKPIMYETIFLKEIAVMNFRKFNVEPPPAHKIRPGLMVALNNTENLSFTLNGIYSVMPKPDPSSFEDIYISLPHYDFISKDTSLSLSRAFMYRERFLGVVGVDMSFADFAEDIIYYDHSPNSYAFLVEKQTGKLLYHPTFSHYNRHSQKHSNKHNYLFDYLHNSLINVEHVEQSTEFPKVKRLIMSESAGSRTIPLSYPITANESFSFFHKGNFMKNPFSTVTYYWRQVASSSFVVVIAEYSQDVCSQGSTKCGFLNSNSLNISLTATDTSFVSHRLDYLSMIDKSEMKLCKHFNQLATIDTATIFLSPNAFASPFEFESDSDSVDLLQRCMRYLTDTKSGEDKNPGLKSGIRADVLAMSSLTSLWKELLEGSETSKYIVRKYIGSASGVFMIYPGTLLDQSYEPKTRPWYRRALENPGKLIFTPPYLDVGGAGYLVTLSQAVLINNPAKHVTDSVWSVMAIDLTLGYFHKIIDEIVPICSGAKSSCFIMDDFGHLIVHSSFLKPALMPFIERQHIAHKETQMVNDLLNHKHFVRKFACNNYNERTIHRYYMFNTSFVGMLTNIAQTGHSSCAKYNLVSLDGTNAFFGVINHTCDNSTTFCPCSLTERHCLNCHRMEQTDCECPCDCPLVMNMCSGQLAESEDNNPPCTAVAEKLRDFTVPPYLFESLNSCINSECFNKHSESECKGVLSCEWCSMDSGFRLKKPFCTNQNLCFGGVYGSKNPYPNTPVYYPEDIKPVHSAPIGPLTTTFLLCFIILTISVYCFHFQSTRNFSNRYLGSNHAEHQILQQANEPNELNEHDFHNNEGNYEAVVSLVHAAVNPNFENIASPYQVNPNYRRPPRVESDYGYSTMNPNEDSDMNGSIYIDAAPIKARDLNRLDLLNISASPTLGTASVTSNDDASVLSSPSSASSATTASSSQQRLPPPPSKLPYKMRSKQRYLDPTSQAISHTPLPTLTESCLLDDTVVEPSQAASPIETS